MKAIVLLMTLPETWEVLVVSLSNSASLTFDGVRGAILDEEIHQKASGESSSSANITRGRAATKNASMQRSRSKSKGKEITCFQCGRKGHKKPDCRFYKQELERRKNKKDTSEKISKLLIQL